MKFILGFLRALKLPVKLLVGLFRKKRKRTELEEKRRKYVRNFAPRHYSWQRSIGKDNKRKSSKKKEK